MRSAAVTATVCGLVDDVLDQLRLVAVRVGAAVHDLDDDLFARVAALNLERQHATDQGKERGSRGCVRGCPHHLTRQASPAHQRPTAESGRGIPTKARPRHSRHDAGA